MSSIHDESGERTVQVTVGDLEIHMIMFAIVAATTPDNMEIMRYLDGVRGVAEEMGVEKFGELMDKLSLAHRSVCPHMAELGFGINGNTTVDQQQHLN